ncbi:pimeloyl-ACP methyl ester carboxylesterase [Mycoplasmopsis mustelae]|uniref:Pimeloyl-ACP methyl ester carboxylesterase n=1 Tax=Mycoplasmopsis mustelae TaxID=171289 RepID=A0A4V3FNW2_9BACT|nr:alpha/beta hydrolase [Mycoplasmopsis mustelae]TDV23569.1 pimeloyl-ACP methyl ester carboxylesterase [Mycoplasmopsis mustelae]
MQSKKIQLLNETIHYIFEDTGKPKVLFLHGFNSASSFANQVYQLQNRNYDVVAIDFPGCGLSSAHSLISIEFYQQIAAEFIRQSGFDFSLVVGHSLGGASALYVLNCGLVSKAILAAPLNHEIFSEFPAKQSLKLYGSKAIERLGKWLLPQTFIEAYESSDNLIYEDKNNYRKNLEKIATGFLNTTKKKYNLFNFMVSNQILSINYLMQNIKSLYDENLNYEFIIGLNDVFVPYLSINSLANKYKKEMLVLENCGHALFFEKPNEVNERINQVILELLD